MERKTVNKEGIQDKTSSADEVLLLPEKRKRLCSQTFFGRNRKEKIIKVCYFFDKRHCNMGMTMLK